MAVENPCPPDRRIAAHSERIAPRCAQLLLVDRGEEEREEHGRDAHELEPPAIPLGEVTGQAEPQEDSDRPATGDSPLVAALRRVAAAWFSDNFQFYVLLIVAAMGVFALWLGWIIPRKGAQSDND